MPESIELVTCGHCRDCKYWEVFSANNRTKGECCRIFDNDVLDRGEPYVHHDTEWGRGSAHLFTPSDFGCVLFEAKETE